MLLGRVKPYSLERVTRNVLTTEVAVDELLVSRVARLDEDVIDDSGKSRVTDQGQLKRFALLITMRVAYGHQPVQAKSIEDCHFRV